MVKIIESKTRTLVKTLLLRVIVFTVITFATVFIFGQSIVEGIEFGIMDIIIELLVHFVYDRIWMGIEWGITVVEETEEISH